MVGARMLYVNNTHLRRYVNLAGIHSEFPGVVYWSSEHRQRNVVRLLNESSPSLYLASYRYNISFTMDRELFKG